MFYICSLYPHVEMLDDYLCFSYKKHEGGLLRTIYKSKGGV